VHPDLARVRDLQDLDRHIADLTQEISYLPKHIAEIESRLEAHKRKLEADRAAVVANQKERKGLEDDVKVQEQKISRLRDQMSEAKTNEQYRAFQHEIDFGQAEIRKIEDRILERMGEAEAFEQNVKTAESALRQEKQEVEKEKREAEQRTASDRTELATAAAQRKELAAAINAEMLANYERIRRGRAGLAVAEVRDGRCVACNVILRLHLYQKLLGSEELITCEACGRILYPVPHEEALEETADCSPQMADPQPSPN
jgi:uncharacterized protein